MRVGRFGFVVVVAVLATACGGTAARPTPSASSAAQSTAPPDPASVAAGTGPSLVFESDRYGYALELPAGWYVRDEAAGQWEPEELNYAGPGTDSFEEDFPGRGGAGKPNYPGVTFGLYVSSAEVPGSTTLDGWMAVLAETVRRDSSCQGEPDEETASIGGERAAALVYDRADCSHDHHVVVLGALHAGRGYAMTWLAKAGEPDARRDVLQDILESFRFTR